MDKSQFKVVDYRNTKQVVYGDNIRMAKMNNRFIKSIMDSNELAVTRIVFIEDGNFAPDFTVSVGVEIPEIRIMISFADDTHINITFDTNPFDDAAMMYSGNISYNGTTVIPNSVGTHKLTYELRGFSAELNVTANPQA